MSEQQLLEPLFHCARERCPFYGFFGTFGLAIPNEIGPSFFDQRGNQCGLIEGSHSPCAMEVRGAVPDWRECAFSGKQFQEIGPVLEELARFFPREFRPEGEQSWAGISYVQWVPYVLGDNAPRFDR